MHQVRKEQAGLGSQGGRALVLLSGGVDSSTLLALAKSEGYDLLALTLVYGQRHAMEVEAARRVAAHIGVERHVIAAIDLGSIGGSALTDQIEVPKDRSLHEIGKSIPVTYVPARNTIFLGLALAWSEVLRCDEILFGANVVDYSGYPDCRPEYIEAFQSLANLATKRAVEEKRPVKIRAPLLQLDKGQIIRLGLQLGLDYGLTLSCYSPSERGEACGKCDACLLRKKGFAGAGIEDPAAYVCMGA
jgi:7-cyano-7-deazaguanine synthase